VLIIIAAKQIMRSQASAGRYFPITLARLGALTRDWALSGGVASESRRLRNPRRTEGTARLLVLLRPGLDVTVYSLPTDVDPGWGEHAVTRALEVLDQWKGEPAEHADGRSRRILVSFHGRSQLRVLDERLKFARRKFGAGEGLSSSRKPKVTSRSLKELATADL
jgi:hypothetical protein